ncbi:peptidase S8 [Paenibacillus tarimensis]|uniref:peptidase S8 n=1 Tax=Paenibacillus tarimensis TaxID=416012 RepID=UPI001F16BE8D|nr:peptidase S8 [Paenibacillus tarimensis]MCF2945205.1 S8 family serine peptidase [Paenibacillus tarimensis]
MKKKSMGMLLSGMMVWLSVFSVQASAADEASKAAAKQKYTMPYEAGGIIVKMKSKSLKAEALMSAMEVAKTETEAQLGLTYMKLKNAAQMEKTLARLNANPNVEYAEPNYIYTLEETEMAAPADVPAQIAVSYNDPYVSNQWGLSAIKAPLAMDLVSSSALASVTIAVVDTGVARTHPDLAGSIVAGYDFVNRDSDANDDQGHGTHVAGIAAGIGNNRIGIAGVASGAKIMPIKVLNASGSGTSMNIVSGMRYAADRGADVLNLSLGSASSCSSAYQDAVNYVRSRGSVVVVASGNSNTAVGSPANCAGTISVGSIDSSMTRSSFSNYGPTLDVTAPGGAIYSTYLSNSYRSLSGTSMAAPHVAGVAALMIAANSSLTPDQVESLLRQSATDAGASGYDSYYGAGIVNAQRAVQLAG